VRQEDGITQKELIKAIGLMQPNTNAAPEATRGRQTHDINNNR
jgi:hypothetical protein